MADNVHELYVHELRTLSSWAERARTSSRSRRIPTCSTDRIAICHP